MLLFERGHVFVFGVAMLREVMYLCEKGVAMLLFERGHVFVLGVDVERGHVFVVRGSYVVI